MGRGSKRVTLQEKAGPQGRPILRPVQFWLNRKAGCYLYLWLVLDVLCSKSWSCLIIQLQSVARAAQLPHVTCPGERDN